MAETKAVPAKVPPPPKSLRQETHERLSAFFSLASIRSYIEQAINDKNLNAPRIIAAALAAVTKDDKLCTCTSQSIFDSVLAATQLQLLVGKELGHAYLVPFKQKGKNGDPDLMICTLILGYKGLIALCRRSGEILSITANVVHEFDEFEASEGTNGHLVHKPKYFGKRGRPLGAYAYAKLAGGGEQFVVMSRDAIESIRNRSQAVDSGPWKRDPESQEITSDELEMWKKTAVRRLTKMLPITIDAADAIADDDDREFNESRDVSPSRSRGALPSAESSGAVRTDSVRTTQADRVKAELGGDEEPEKADAAKPPPGDRAVAEAVRQQEAEKPKEQTDDEKREVFAKYLSESVTNAKTQAELGDVRGIVAGAEKEKKITAAHAKTLTALAGKREKELDAAAAVDAAKK